VDIRCTAQHVCTGASDEKAAVETELFALLLLLLLLLLSESQAAQ